MNSDSEQTPGGNILVVDDSQDHLDLVLEMLTQETIIRRTDGTVTWVDVGGIPLGVGLSAEFSYREKVLSLTKGDLVILASDGVVEASNGSQEMFGFDRLEQAVASGPQTSAQAMLEHLKTRVSAFVGQTEPHDDLTLIVAQP